MAPFDSLVLMVPFTAGSFQSVGRVPFGVRSKVPYALLNPLVQMALYAPIRRLVDRASEMDHLVLMVPFAPIIPGVDPTLVLIVPFTPIRRLVEQTPEMEHLVLMVPLTLFARA